MANQHKHPLVGIRGCPPEVATAVREQASAQGETLSAVTVALWRWWVGEASEPPPRPLPAAADSDDA